MRQFTLSEKLANAELALKLWKERVRHHQVSPELRSWGLQTPNCGTQACFGGHLALWPEFRALGVRQLAPNSTVCSDDGLSSWEVSQRLFDDSTLFYMRGEANNERMVDPVALMATSDHQLVVRRLEHIIQRLTYSVEMGR